VPDYERIAAEFGLGDVKDVSPLAGARSAAIRLTTSGGVFVVKPVHDTDYLELAQNAAVALNGKGIRQAQPLRSAAGDLVSDSGYGVTEFVPGQVCLRPSRAQINAIMRHLAEYHEVLADVPVPATLTAADTLWTRVTSAEYLLQQLPELFGRFGPRNGALRLVAAALGQVESSLPLIRGLGRQLVHGDIGPDNVIMDGDEVVAFIDFTPHYQPVLFAVATAAYWVHVHGRPEPDAEAIWASLMAAAPPGDWSAVERAVWPSMLLLEALRRLATPLALAAETGADVPASTGARYEAVAALIESWPTLSQARR
jgi:Ser/Thr protein kinase RdoA (MazF antagonist)